MALVMIAWTALETAEKADEVIGKRSRAAIEQKATLDRLTDEMAGSN